MAPKEGNNQRRHAAAGTVPGTTASKKGFNTGINMSRISGIKPITAQTQDSSTGASNNTSTGTNVTGGTGGTACRAEEVGKKQHRKSQIEVPEACLSKSVR